MCGFNKRWKEVDDDDVENGTDNGCNDDDDDDRDRIEMMMLAIKTIATIRRLSDDNDVDAWETHDDENGHYRDCRR